MPQLKFAPFGKLDSRVAAELKGQQRTIILGLICVVAATSLDGAIIPLLERSITAIQDAAPRRKAEESRFEERKAELDVQADAIARELGIPKKPVEVVFEKNQRLIDRDRPGIEERQIAAEAEIVGPALGLPPSKIQAILGRTRNQPGGDFQAVRRLGFLSLIVVLVFGVKYWFTRGQSFYLTAAAARLSSDLRNRLFAKLQRLPVSYFATKRVGAIQSVLTNDVNVYQNAVGVLRDTISAPITVTIAFGYVLYAQARLAFVVLLFVPAMVYVINRNGRKIKASQAAVQADLSEVSATTTESLQGMRVIKAFAAEDESQARYGVQVERSYESQVAAGRRFAALRPMVELIGAVALATVLYICGWLSFLGQLQLGQIAAVIFALDKMNQGVRSISSVNGTLNQVQAASERIHHEVLDVPEQHERDGAQVLPAPVGRIEFRHVSFRYPDGTEALRDVSFTLEPGTSLALVGPSGAGKSTIADLLLRFYDPTEGQILFDGVDLRDLRLDWWRNQIGVVPQNTFLFAGSVAENIRMGKPDATDEEVRTSAVAANADEFIAQMERGYNSDVGEGGSRISGGQRQRVAIARALVRQPKLLLLDEATSALDASSERAVTEALDEVMHDRTSLFIAHRLTTAARADRILVLSRGRVVEEGTHSELMERNGQYAALFRIFSGGLIEGDLAG